jgi:hypothetical protein
MRAWLQQWLMASVILFISKLQNPETVMAKINFVT